MSYKHITPSKSAHCLAQYTSTTHTHTWPSLRHRKKKFKKEKKKITINLVIYTTAFASLWIGLWTFSIKSTPAWASQVIYFYHRFSWLWMENTLIHDSFIFIDQKPDLSNLVHFYFKKKVYSRHLRVLLWTCGIPAVLWSLCVFAHWWSETLTTCKNLTCFVYLFHQYSSGWYKRGCKHCMWTCYTAAYTPSHAVK